jgi:hypothetical protein
MAERNTGITPVCWFLIRVLKAAVSSNVYEITIETITTG